MDREPTNEALRGAKHEEELRRAAQRAMTRERRDAGFEPPAHKHHARTAVTWLALAVVAVLAIGALVGLLRNRGHDVAAQPTGDRVYAGTPAETWERGADGFRVPEVKSGSAKVAKAADAMRAYVRRYLVTALLDPRVVLEGDIQPYLDVIGPEQAAVATSALQGISARESSDELHWEIAVNRFRPGDWRQVAEPRVMGRTTVSYPKDGCAMFSISYAVAYALEPVSGGPTRPIVVRRDSTITLCPNASVPGVGDISIGPGHYVSLGSICGADWPYVGFVEAWPDPATAPVESPSPVESDWDPTNLDTSTGGEGCFTDTSGFGSH